MAKYTEKLTEKIVSLIEEDTYSISEICKTLNISRKSFYEWKDTKQGFKKAIEKATERRDDKLLMIARRSLKKKLEGYTLTETRTTYVPDMNDPEKLVLKSQVVKQKEYAPDTHAIKLMLLHNDTRTKKEENIPPALTIVVRDSKTAEQLNLLQRKLVDEKNLENKEPETKPGQVELPAIANTTNTATNPVLQKRSKYVKVNSIVNRMVPPGYRYRG